jgi:hypothetical protein
VQPPEAMATKRSARLQRQRLQVDLWILPDLRIDEALEGLGEDPFPYAIERCWLKRCTASRSASEGLSPS